MGLNRLWVFLAVALPVVASLLASMSTVDLAYHLRAGAEILSTRSIPSVDTWTFTAAGQPWVDQQWGAQAVFAVTERFAGWTGLAILRGALTGVIFACVTLIDLRRGLDARTASLLAIVVFVVAAPAMALRPQLLGMACLAIVLVLVTDRRAHPRALWLIPVIVAVWANLHGSFFLGPVVLGLAWLEDLHDRVPNPHQTLLVAVVSVAAAFLTPFGPLVWVYAVALSVNPEVTSRITEWQPTSLRSIPGILFFVSAFAVVVLIARRGRPTPWPTLAWLAVFFLIGVYALRGVAWWPLGAVAAIAGVLVTGPVEDPERPEPLGSPLMRRLNLVVVGAIVLAGVALLPVWRPIEPGLDAPAGVVGNAPPGISAALRATAGPNDRLFNPQPWGSWFEFALPDLPVAIDSRIELFPAAMWDTYENIVAGGEGWAGQLDDWGVTIVVVPARDTAMAERLAAAGWRSAYADSDGSVLVAPDR
jgi:hypothetical protein